MIEELSNIVVGDYRIKLYKHPIVKKGTYRNLKPYELEIIHNNAFSGETPDWRTIFHDYFKKKKEALDIIKTIPKLR